MDPEFLQEKSDPFQLLLISCTQYRITCAVPKRIIELLKTIEIELYHTKWSIPSLNLVDIGSQNLHQIAQVG